MNGSVKGTVAIAALAAGLMGAFQARAQTQTAPSAGSSDTGTRVEDIVVTAQKRSENLQDVPIAITAITGDTAKAAGVNATTDLAAVTPGLTVTQTSTAPLYFLRGIGTALSLVGDEGSVSVVLDGVPLTTLTGSILSLNNIERVEVLRGPQGTLFGRNADGGVINIITRDPSKVTSGDFSLGYGSYNTVTGSSYLTTGLGSNAAIDAAVQFTHQADGFGTDLVTGLPVNRSRNVSVRSKLLFEPTDMTRIVLSGDYYRSTGDTGIPRHLIAGAVGVFGGRIPANFQDVNENIQPRAKEITYGGTLRIEQGLSFAKVTSITAYRHTYSAYDFDQDVEAVPLVNAFFKNPEHQLSQEIQLASLESSKLKWILGGFYLSAKAQGDPIQLAGLAFAAIGGYQNRYGTIDTRSLAGFGQASYPVTDTTNVTVGLRYTSDQRRYTYFQTSPVPVPFTADTTQTFNKLTWRFSVDQKLDDHVLLYASASRGFKSGLFNVITPTNPPIKPEVLDAFEGGLKTELFDRRLRFNISGFYYNYKDIQIGQIVSGTSFFLNAARAHIYGADVDFEARPVPRVTLSGGFELLHARYASFPNAPATFPSPIVDADPATPGVQCGTNAQLAAGPRTGGNTVCTVDASGKQLVRAPDAQFTLTGRYVLPTSIGPFGLSATWQHTATFPWEPDGRLQQKPTNIVNAQLSWDASNKSYGVRFWVRNLTDEQYYLQVSSSIADSGEPAAPRTFGGSVQFHF